jgi:DNA-binding transcriptional ArsR family regulator
MKSKDAIAALAALAQDARLAVFRLLVAAGPAGMAAGDIARRLSIPAPTLSFHLTQLQHAGLVKSRRQGRHLIQTAAFDRMAALVAYLTDNCCGGDPAACLPAAKAKCAPTRARRRSAA